jgi:AcrR family transcriptional regulator
MKARGRRTSDSRDSKQAILSAARSLFAKRGFRSTTLRAVARRARVDVALVSYFFGSKAELFTAVVDLPMIADQLERMLTERGPGLGERIVRFYLEQVFTAKGESISALLRTALGSPEDIPQLRALLRKTVLRGMSSTLAGPTAELRAELIGAQMTGLFISRHLVRVEPLASAPVADIASLLGPTIDALLGVGDDSHSPASVEKP